MPKITKIQQSNDPSSLLNQIPNPQEHHLHLYPTVFFPSLPISKKKVNTQVPLFSPTVQPTKIALKSKTTSHLQQFINYGCGCKPAFTYTYSDDTNEDSPRVPVKKVITCDILDPYDIVAGKNITTTCCQDLLSFRPAPIIFPSMAKGSGDTLLLNGIQLGPGDNQRLGSLISQQTLEIEIALISNSFQYNDVGFWAIVLDRQSNGMVASFSDIFDMHLFAQGNYVLGAGVAFTRRDTGNRFQLLIKERWAVGSMPYHYWNTFNLNNFTSEFNSSSSSSCGIPITGALILAWGSVADNKNPFYYNARLYFADH